MVEPVQELIGGNINIQLMFRKRDQVGIVEKGLIAEVDYHEEEDPSAELVKIIENRIL
jgi:hypothetical protein